MATTTISGSGKRNNGSSVLYGNKGSASTVTNLNTPNLTVVGNHAINMKPVLSPNSAGASGYIKIISGGNFATENQILTYTYTTKLCNVNSTALTFPAADVGNRRSINVKGSIYTRHVRYANMVFDFQRGVFTTTPSGTIDTLGTDRALPTRAIPGKVFFQVFANNGSGTIVNTPALTGH